MRGRELITVLVLVGCLSGCTWVQDRWPWSKKDVPVTAPTEVSPADVAPAKVSPAKPGRSAAARPEKTRPASPAVRSASARPEETRPEETRPAAAPHTSPAGRQTAGRDLRAVRGGGSAAIPTPADEPIMLENLVPGVAPIPNIQLPSAEPWREMPPGAGSPAGPEPKFEAVAVDKSPPAAPQVKPQPAGPLARPLAGSLAAERTAPAQSPPPGRNPSVGQEPSRPKVTAPAVPPAAPRLVPGQMEPPRALPKAKPIEYGKEEVVAASLLAVNDKFLTVDDVLRQAGPALAAQPAGLSKVEFRSRAEQIIRSRTQNMVLEWLIYTEAQNRLTDEQKKSIDQQLDQDLRLMTAKVGGSRQKLQQVMAERGSDLKTVLADKRRALSVRAFLRQRFYPAITVTRTMLWDYYRKHISQFTTPAKVQMQIIAAPYASFLPKGVRRPTAQQRQASINRARAVINDAAQAVRSGEDFGQVARRESRGIKASAGGVWPMMEAGNFRQQKVEAAAFALAEGHVSDVIQTDTGYYIVKARKVQPARTTSFEQAQEQIDWKLRQRQVDKMEQKYFQTLLRRSHVSQSDQFFSLAVDRAVATYWRP